jgi:hypothetical protein
VESLGDLVERAPIFMMGVGNATYLQELMACAKVRLVVVVYEPSLEIFLDFLEHVELEPWMKKHTVVFCVDGVDDEAEDELSWIVGRILNYESLPFSRTLILPNYDVLFPEEALGFIKMCRNRVKADIVQYNTTVRFENVQVKNVLANVRYLPDCYKTTQLVKVIPRDIPGIVVAAGPSLNKNIQELKKAKGKAFIIAADTAIKPMLKAGIEPDMFVVVDGGKPQSLIDRPEVQNIPLLTALSASSDFTAYHTGAKYLANEGYPIVDRLLARGDAQIGPAVEGGSVATTAFSLLYKIGLKTIILVGQDLALTGNRTHADGTFEEHMPEVDVSHAIMVPGNVEEQVPTRQDFQVYLEWYNQTVETLKEKIPGIRVINATEGGARIEGTEIMTLREAIEQECTKPVDIQECLGRLHPLFEGEDREWVIGQIKEIPQACERLGNEAKKALKLYKKLDYICGRFNIDQKAYRKIIKRLDKQVKKVESDELYRLVEITIRGIQHVIKSGQFTTCDTIQEEGKEIARQGIIYMKCVVRCMEIFQEYTAEIYADWEP